MAIINQTGFTDVGEPRVLYPWNQTRGPIMGYFLGTPQPGTFPSLASEWDQYIHPEMIPSGSITPEDVLLVEELMGSLQPQPDPLTAYMRIRGPMMSLSRSWEMSLEQ